MLDATDKVLGFENDECVNINQTSLKGHITTTYDKLVEVFGEPTYTDASPYEKVNAQWTLDFTVHKNGDPYALLSDFKMSEDYEDNVVATIYNWKDGYVPTEEYEWHIGGFSTDAVDCVQNCLDSAKELV